MENTKLNEIRKIMYKINDEISDIDDGYFFYPTRDFNEAKKMLNTINKYVEDATGCEVYDACFNNSITRFTYVKLDGKLIRLYTYYYEFMDNGELAFLEGGLDADVFISNNYLKRIFEKICPIFAKEWNSLIDKKQYEKAKSLITINENRDELFGELLFLEEVGSFTLKNVIENIDMFKDVLGINYILNLKDCENFENDANNVINEYINNNFYSKRNNKEFYNNIKVNEVHY